MWISRKKGENRPEVTPHYILKVTRSAYGLKPIGRNKPPTCNEWTHCITHPAAIPSDAFATLTAK